MATDTQPSPLEQLTALLDEYGRQTSEWWEKLPILRAKTVASGVVLDRLAQTWPTDPPPRRGYADVVLAAPTREWAREIVAQLRNALPFGAQVDLGARGEGLRDGQPLTGFTVSCQVSAPGVSGATVTKQVRTALANMEDLEVDYTEPLDLIVVSPRV
jgi:hypothetical protein